MGPQSPSIIPAFLSPIPSLSIQTCSPAQTHFLRSPVVSNHSKTAKGTLQGLGSSPTCTPALLPPSHPNQPHGFSSWVSCTLVTPVLSGGSWGPRSLLQPEINGACPGGAWQSKDAGARLAQRGRIFY